MKVLVVDDEALIRLAVRGVLEDHGIVVVEAPNGARALEVLKSEPDIAVLFTDVQMPVMGGLELVEHAERLRPEVGIVITTGYADIKMPERLPTLYKPWNDRELIEVVEGAMKSPPPVPDSTSRI